MTPDGGFVQPSKMKPFFTLKYKNGGNQYTLLGVVSGSLYCASKFPDFYTFIGQEEVIYTGNPIGLLKY